MAAPSGLVVLAIVSFDAGVRLGVVSVADSSSGAFSTLIGRVTSEPRTLEMVFVWEGAGTGGPDIVSVPVPPHPARKSEAA
jgi:hypothetical protein